MRSEHSKMFFRRLQCIRSLHDYKHETSFRGCLFGCLFVCLALLARIAIAQPEPSASNRFHSDPLRSLNLDSGNCGTVSVFMCIRAIGSNPGADDKTDGEVVSRISGSTILDLQRIAKISKVDSYIGKGWTVSDLGGLSAPAVLHVRTGLEWQDYNHWVAYLGRDGSKFRIFDVNGGLQSIDPLALDAIWDGQLLVVGSKEPYYRYSLLQLTLVCQLVVVCMIRAVDSSAGKERNSTTSLSSLFCGVVLFGCVAVIGGLVYQVGRNNGIPARQIIETISTRIVAGRYCMVTRKQVDERIARRNALLVDVRPRSRYDLGTIPGAISLPIDATIPLAEIALANADKDDPIILFCESQECRYSHVMADFLVANRFENVCIYEPGYVGWMRGTE